MARTWIATPVYRDVESFLLLRERLLEILADRPGDVRFVVLDDTAGLDPQIERLREPGDVTVLQPPFNLGHQRALVYALRKMLPEFAPDDLVVTLDADGEDRPEDLPHMIDALEGAGPGDAVALAIRTQRQESLTFKAMYLSFRLLFRSLTGTTVRSGNFAAMRGATAKRILAHPAFDLSYSSTMLALDLPIVPVPCPRGKRYVGESKMTFGRLALHGVRMLMPFTDRIALRALFLFAAALALGIGLAAAVLGVQVFTDSAIPDWATYTAVSAVIVSLVALGNFVTLFVLFSQTRAVSLASIEELDERRSPPVRESV